MLFNLVRIAASGTASSKPRNVGLYGPVILISRQEYEKAGGHESVKNSIVEDMAPGARLKSLGLPFRLLIGNPDVSFLNVSSGLCCLLEGWVKNMATGASGMPASIFVMVFLWITSLIFAPLHLVIFIISVKLPWLIVYGLLHVVWICFIAALTRRIGRFPAWVFIFYPILILVLLGVFVFSGYKKLFGLKVTWPGRALKTGEKACD